MTNCNREIEKKWLIRGAALDLVSAAVESSCKLHEVAITSRLRCQTRDFYWQLGKTQFVRLRDSWGTTADGFSRSLKEITTKAKDKGSNIDRLEINLAITDSQQAYSLLTALAGQPLGSVRKDEFILFTADGAIISAAEINGDLYLEVEGRSVEQVDDYARFLLPSFYNELELRSLFEIYVQAA